MLFGTVPKPSYSNPSLPGIYNILMYPYLEICGDVGMTLTPQRTVLAEVQRADYKLFAPQYVFKGDGILLITSVNSPLP